MELNKRVAQLRSSLRQNQDWMAKELGISKNHYSRIETGRSKPSLDLLQKIADVTKTELIVLLSDKPLPRREGKCETRIALEKDDLIPVKKSTPKKVLKKSSEKKEVGTGIVPVMINMSTIDTANKTPKDVLKDESSKKSSAKFNLEEAVKKNTEKLKAKKK